jgi:hypothetical protein
MPDDLVKRLREVEGEKLDFTNTSNGLRLSAADRIEELSNCVAVLEAKLAKAVEALEDVAGVGFDAPMAWAGTDAEWERKRANAMQWAAKDALRKITGDTP